MSKVHLKITGVDCREQGQTLHEYNHQALCGYVRDNVTVYAALVDCKICIREMKKKVYRL